ncbi:ankyrin repeat-containing domain protein [Phyllosticta citriasiana]|uniref:ankyrin repeat-containing domain protein n=1 Tax=Phyllosticta citriasiana TaxID=595635 RepID=UPI0030FDDEE3
MLAFEEIIAKSRYFVKVVVCSREENDIKDRLGHARDISLTSRQNGKDLSRFIKLKVKDFITKWGQKPGKKLDELAELEKDIACALENGAQGMFLWVTLQLEAIRDTEQVVFDEDIRDALTHLPVGLKKSFDAVRGRITSMENTAQSVALLVLKWLLCAQRTLSVQELVAAVSGGIRGKRQFSVAEILSCCCGLVVLDSELDVFRLPHLLVREPSPLTDFAPIKDVLINYSTIYWSAHCEAVGVSNRDAALKAMLLKFFTEEEHFEDWQESLADKLKSQDVRWHGDLIKKLNAVPSSPPSPLFAICCFGLSEVLEHLTASGLLQDLEHFNKHNANGLYLAAHFGHEVIVKILIGRGCDVSAVCARFGSAVKAAAFFGHCSIVQLLLEHHAATESGPGDFSNPLQAALAGGHEDIVEVLLRSDFKFSTNDEFDEALQFAAFKGHARLVEHLLQGKLGDYVPSESHDPLQVALHGCMEKESKRQLQGYPDINAEVGYFGNALQAAIIGGKLSHVQLVHKAGASLDSRGSFGFPIRAAAIASRDDILLWLLDQGGQRVCRDNMISTSLRRRRLPFLESIVQNFPDVGDLGSIGPSILQEAAYHGDVTTVASLLDKGIGTAFCDQALIRAASARFDSEFEQTGNRYIPPAEAEKIWLDGMLEVIRILVEAGAEVKPLKEKEQSFTSQIFQHGTLQFLELLDRRGLAIVPHGDSLEFQEILQKASNVGNLDAVKYLVQKAHKADHTGHPSYAPALKSAVNGGQKNVVEFLLDLTLSGDIFNVVDDNPLLEATRVKNLETTQLLLREIDHNPLVIQAALEIMFKGEDMYSYGWCSTSSEEPEKQTRRLQSLLQSLRFKTDVSPLCTRFLSDALASLKEGPLGLFLAHGANPNTKSAEGSIQLYQASKNNCAAQVKILLESGANLNLEGGEFGTPLHAAARKGALDVVDLLIKAGADVNHRFGHYGYPLTATMTGSGYVERYLLRRKDIRIAELLVENGADVDAQGGFYGSYECRQRAGRQGIAQNGCQSKLERGQLRLSIEGFETQVHG